MTFSLTLSARDLKTALDIASQVTDSGVKVAVLKSVRIEVAERATFIATNMDHSIRVSFPATGKGLVHLDTAMLAQKAAALRPDQDVTMKGDGAFVTVTQGRTRWKLPVILGDGFPAEVTEAIDWDAVTIKCSTLFSALATVSRIINPGDTRIIGRGPYLDMKDGFRVVACSGTGMAVIQIDQPELPVNVILPNEAVAAAKSIFKDVGDADVVATNDAICISREGVMYRSKLVEGAYVDWRMARDHNSAKLDGSVTLPTKPFMQSIERATAIAEDKTKSSSSVGARFTFADNACSISAKNRIGEEGEDQCEAVGDHGTFGVSSDNIWVALDSIGSERVKMTFNTSEDGPIKVEPDTDSEMDNYRIVMGMRV